MTPTKEGHYYWRLKAASPWYILHIEPDAHGNLVASVPEEYPIAERVDTMRGEWGIRIPSPARLEAMEEICSERPARLVVCGSGFDEYGTEIVCGHCGSKADEDGNVEHTDTCPWRRAQETQP